MARTHRPRSSSVRERRRHRERAIVEATRATFDRRMRRDASVDELAHRAGLSKALVYRAFDSKEEIFVLTLTDYLGELATRLQTPPDGGPVNGLRAVSTCYAEFCLEYPAFVDCAMALICSVPGKRASRGGLRRDLAASRWRAGLLRRADAADIRRAPARVSSGPKAQNTKQMDAGGYALVIWVHQDPEKGGCNS